MSRLLEKLLKLMNKLVWLVGPYWLGTSMNTIWRGWDRRGKTILDVGGGWGEPMAFLNKKHSFQLAVNADLSLTRLKQSKRKGIHNECVLCDARNLPFKKKSFDTVLCLEVIEHMPKEDGFKFLLSLEEIARRQVILSTPVGEKIDSGRGQKKDPVWCHFSSWRPAEFYKLGYNVRGDGFPCIKGRLLVASTNKILAFLGYLLYPIASPFVYFFPDKAGGMTCIKQINGNS